LAAAVAPTLFNKLQQAEQTRVAQDIRTIEGELKFYYLDSRRYPSQSDGLEALVSAPGGATNWNGPYMESLPKDPWGKPYLYANPSSHNRRVDVYTLGADGVTGGEGPDKDWGNWNIQ
jgi:general secretion pathway protein G